MLTQQIYIHFFKPPSIFLKKYHINGKNYGNWLEQASSPKADKRMKNNRKQYS